MGHKLFCDVCSKEIPLNSAFKPSYSHFQTPNNAICICTACTFAIENYVKELKGKYRALETLRSNPRSVRDQKDLDGFH